MIIITATSLQAEALKRSQRYPHAHFFSWQSWVDFCVEKNFANVSFLNKIEEKFFWQQSISQNLDRHKNVTQALVKEVQNAWWLLHHFCVDITSLQSSFHEPSQWLYRVIKAYQKNMQVNQCLDKYEALTRFLSHPFFEKLPSTIYFYGFLRFTPLQEKMQKVLKENGVDVNVITFSFEIKNITPDEIENQSHSVHKSREDTASVSLEEAELAYLTLFDAMDAAIDQIISLPENQRIALITTELSHVADYLENKLQTYSYHLQLPKALAKFSDIQTALTILSQQGKQSWSLETLAVLSRSPYWGEVPDDKIQRAKFMLRVRALAVNTIDTETLLSLGEVYPDWKNLFYLLLQKSEKKKQPMSAWIMHWKNVLSTIHFVPEAITRWENLLDVLSKSFASQNFNEREAITILKSACQETLVSEEINTVHPTACPRDPKNLHIAKPLDILSENFDHIFWLDVTQEMTIIPVPINSFIDPQIQRQYHFWAQDPLFNETLGEECFRILQERCTHLYLSYPMMRNDKAQQPARFVFSLDWKRQDPCHSAACPRDPKNLGSRAFARDDIPSLENESRLNSWPSSEIPGGSGALKSQHLCPMQAFAKYRLHAEALPESTLGLTPVERGIVTHRALQLIWQQLETQEALVKFLNSPVLDRIVSLALNEISYARRKQLPKALFHLEQKSLIDLLYQWLQKEATRPPFKIYALEKSINVTFAEHQWRLRIDRIDELADGRLLLIDYKTGAASINACLPENFTEPQLPFYVVTQSANIDAIALAEISSKNIRCTGLTRDTLGLGELGVLKVVSDWDDLKTQWQDLLASLTNEFVHSQAVLKPRDGAGTCQACGLQSFCRIGVC